MNSEPNQAVTQAWTRLMRAQHAALSAIERRLKAADHPPLVWYDVLLELERGPAAGLRPFELEQAMLLPQYGLSRLIDRIEAAGYVERRPCAADGRGQVVIITDAGRALRRRMWPDYAEGIARAIADRLTTDEAEALAALLGKLSA